MEFRSRSHGPRRWRKVESEPPLKWNPSPFMLSRRPLSPPQGGAPVALCRVMLALMHLSVVATAHAAQQTLNLPQSISAPYLIATRSPALRFQEAPVTTPLTRKPVASGPPFVASTPEVAEVALANNHAAASTPPMPISQPESTSPEASAASKPPEAIVPPSKMPPILPDDTRRKVQSQDFLPLFRFPGGDGSNPDVIVPGIPTLPAPAPLPPSSATYRQQ